MCPGHTSGVSGGWPGWQSHTMSPLSTEPRHSCSKACGAPKGRFLGWGAVQGAPPWVSFSGWGDGTTTSLGQRNCVYWGWQELGLGFTWGSLLRGSRRLIHRAKGEGWEQCHRPG